jgi:hypothetical protein
MRAGTGVRSYRAVRVSVRYLGFLHWYGYAVKQKCGSV